MAVPRRYLEGDSMAKRRTTFICQQCGMSSPGYLGRCPGMWRHGTRWLRPSKSGPRSTGARKPLARSRSRPARAGRSAASDRFRFPIEEIDRVLGGGLVPGSLVLLGGDPGIGKSTLVLQAASELARATRNVSMSPARNRRSRSSCELIALAPPPNGSWYCRRPISARISPPPKRRVPGLLIVDSIQTVYIDEMSSAAGSVSQVRECTARLMQWAKPRNIPVLIVGHVTKEGAIAGPRVLEHMVDAVLYLEGERHHQYRILRAVKNRFGSTDEVGVFEMADAGLREVRNPSEAFLEERNGNAAGTTVAVTMEGTRPILVEMQALTTTTAYGLPRRSAKRTGLESPAAAGGCAAKAGWSCAARTRHLRECRRWIAHCEPAADLAVAMAIASSSRSGRSIRERWRSARSGSPARSARSLIWNGD